MERLISQIRTAADRRRAYVRTVHEIENMPLEIAQDLGVFREDAREIARKAVYG